MKKCSVDCDLHQDGSCGGLGERFCSRGIETYDLSIVKVYFYDQFI
jgi:hypothetical protein